MYYNHALIYFGYSFLTSCGYIDSKCFWTKSTRGGKYHKNITNKYGFKMIVFAILDAYRENYKAFEKVLL